MKETDSSVPVLNVIIITILVKGKTYVYSVLIIE